MKFILNKDKLTIESVEEINSGSVNYYEADVEYDSSWNGLIIKAVLVRNGEEEGKEIAVIGNKVFIDKKEFGWHCIGFVGYRIENEAKTYQISTDLQAFCIQRGAGGIDVVESGTPTATEWELYIAQIEKIANGISDEIAEETMTKVQLQIDEIREIADNAEDNAETAVSIAKGANQSLVYGDYNTMITALNAIAKETYKVGQNILIITLNVADLWISAIAEKSIEYTYTSDDDFVAILKEQGYVQVGYYKLSALETQKVELGEYVKNTDYATLTKAGVVKAGQNGIYIDGAGNLYVGSATKDEIDRRAGNYKPIVPTTLDYAVGSVFPVVTQAEYDELVANGTVNENLYYCIVEEE